MYAHVHTRSTAGPADAVYHCRDSVFMIDRQLDGEVGHTHLWVDHCHLQPRLTHRHSGNTQSEERRMYINNS